MSHLHLAKKLRTHLSNNEVEHQLRRLMEFLGDSAQYINYEVKMSQRGQAGTRNMYGEDQMELDVLADKILEERLRAETSFGVKDFASEERGEIIRLNTNGMRGDSRYSVTTDPLDGSSLLDVNLSVGTIFGIHDGQLMDGRSGRESLAAAMYIVYGPETTLVYTSGQGTHEFVLNPVGHWVLMNESVQMQDKGKIYSPGALDESWTKEHAAFIQHLRVDKYKLRYSGALVADFNQVLMKGGGLFTYPGNVDKPEGKLRLLFELQPLAMIIEQAGGVATDGERSILEIVPEKLDQRSPIYIGSAAEVQLARKYISGEMGK
jgi:fructose-1,6-bisphosphatase I